MANLSKSQLVKVDSTQRPKFQDLPKVGASGWFALFVGYDPDIKIIGLNHIMLSIKSSNKKIRFNLQRVLRRESGTYTVLGGSGELEPFSKKSHSWSWGPDAIAGLPITAIVPDGGDDIRGVMIAQLQLEVTDVSTQSTEPAAQTSEALEMNCKVKTVLSGDLDRKQAQGNLYVVPIPPPTNEEGTNGDFSPIEHVVQQVAKGDIEFPGNHYCKGNTPPYFSYMTREGQSNIIEELNNPVLWGEYFKLPHALPYGTWDDDGNSVQPPTVMCNYGRIGRLTEGDTMFPAGTYVMVPQPLGIGSNSEVVVSVQQKGYAEIEWNDIPDTSLFTPNSMFLFEGLDPSSTSSDLVVDGVSLTSKGKTTQGYKIHRFVDRELKTSKSTRIPMPKPDVSSFLGGMPLDLCTPNGISNAVLLRNGRELKSFWPDFLRAVVSVVRTIVDVADAISEAGAEDGLYIEQYTEARELARRAQQAGAKKALDCRNRGA